MSSGYDIDGVKCIAEAASGKSLLMQCDCEEFQVDDSHADDDKAWVPKKQITDDSEVYSVGDEGQLCVTEWLAEQRGWL